MVTGAQAAGAAGGPAEEPVFTELNARRLGPVRRYFLRHPRVMDALVVAIFAVPATLSALFDDSLPRDVPAMLTMTALGALALVWRRVAPLPTAVAVGVLAVTAVATTGTLNGYDLAIAFVVYAVAASHRPRTAWITLAALVLPAAGGVLLWESPVDLAAGPFPVEDGTQPAGGADMRGSSVTALALLGLVAIAAGTSVRNRRLHVGALVDRANALAVERDQGAQLAAAAERARIAREMHDVVAHSLSVMIALADGAGAAMERSPDRAREALDELSGTGRAALADMRRVLGALRDAEAPLDPQPGSVDLDHLVDRFRTAGVPVRWTRTGPALPADAGLQLAVYRIVQEALTNVLRHAPGTGRVDVVLASTDSRVEITVTDSGAALGRGSAGSTDGSGRGLIGMRERAAVYGGRVDAGPHDGGWRVHAVLTWDE
ncbi:two-component sensor histidine kinase [Cellulomonas aerilata]|uniref:histidine kinase n=1 Tax=Cellulomonas aerilata TaxID=515326 RepID=A0A512DDW7_9CELL|nr:two-component sensor histidine kinase [Cellulomonas aerilata]